MSNYYYKKSHAKSLKLLVRLLSLGVAGFGISLLIYIFSPLISWQLYFAPVFAASQVAAPIPKTTIVSGDTFQSLLSEASKGIGTDFGNALNWFPNHAQTQSLTAKIPVYYLSIPKLAIKNAVVSTQDYDLNSHLINYIGTALPPDNGTAVIFGHSTLPQWFDPKNYKAIFATAYLLKTGDEIFLDVSGVVYRYSIFNTLIVSPEDDNAVFSQNYDNSHLTLVTCTPPGTTWKRLLIKARLQKL